MAYHRAFSPEMFRPSIGHQSCIVLDTSNGCTGECLAGISQYGTTEYPEAQIHDFQEGFYVIEGEGTAMVDGTEFPLEPGTSFLVPAGKPHALRKNADAASVRVFWFHSA